MKPEIDPELIESLFQTLRLFVDASGGDGDAWVIAPHRYEELSKLFLEKELERDGGFSRRSGEAGCITFTNDQGQESVTFIDSRDHLPEWAGDLIIEIRY